MDTHRIRYRLRIPGGATLDFPLEFSGEDIGAMASRRRAAFVNSLSGFKSANLVGSADRQGHTNLAIMSSAVHLGSHPPLLALVIRPGGLDHYHTPLSLKRMAYAKPHLPPRIL